MCNKKFVFLVFFSYTTSFASQIDCFAIYKKVISLSEKHLSKKSFVDVGTFLEKQSHQLCDLKRENIERDVVWIGPEVPRNLKVTVRDFGERLSAKVLDHLLTGPSQQDANSALIEIGSLLGSEQGRRLIWLSGNTGRTPELFQSLEVAIKNKDEVKAHRILQELKAVFAQSTQELAAQIKSIVQDPQQLNQYVGPEVGKGWPVDGKLLPEKYLIDALKDAHNQLYTVTPKKGSDPEMFYRLVIHSGMIMTAENVHKNHFLQLLTLVNILEAMPLNLPQATLPILKTLRAAHESAMMK